MSRMTRYERESGLFAAGGAPLPLPRAGRLVHRLLPRGEAVVALVEHVDDVALRGQAVRPGVVLELEVEVGRGGEGGAVHEEHGVLVGGAGAFRLLLADEELDAGVEGVDVAVGLHDLRALGMDGQRGEKGYSTDDGFHGGSLRGSGVANATKTSVGFATAAAAPPVRPCCPAPARC